jgi:hypothetical protein
MVDQKKDTWLEDMQLNSWSPEVIISGLMLAFILSFPNSIYDFVTSQIQERGISFLAGVLVLVYLLMIVNIFKVFLIGHLALRFIWAGLLGISYAFPDGVIEKNLFDYMKGFKFLDIKDMVYNLERTCSMAFGIPIVLGLIFIPITLYLGVFIVIYKIFDLDFYILYVLFLVSLLVFMAIGLLAKKLNIKLKTNNYAYTISALYSSNIGAWKFNIYTLLLMVVTLPFINSDIKGFSSFFNEINTNQDRLDWPNEEWYYQDKREAKDRFGRVLLPSQKVDNDQLSVYIAHYEEDFKNMEKLKKYHQYSLDTLKWQKPNTAKDLYRVYINDSLVTTSEWQKSRLPLSGQKVFNTRINITAIPKGNHTLRFEKLVNKTPMFDNGAAKKVPKWAVVNFEKV